MQRTKDLNSMIVASCDKKLLENFKTDVYIEGRLSQCYLVPGSRLTLLETTKTTIRVFMAKHQLSKRAEPTVGDFAQLVRGLGWHKASIAALEQLLPKLLSWIDREATRIGVVDINIRKLNGRLEIGDSVWPAYTVTWLIPGWDGNTNRPAGATTQTRPMIQRSVRLGPIALVRLTLQTLAESACIECKEQTVAQSVKSENHISPSPRLFDLRSRRVSRAQSSAPPLEPELLQIVRNVMADDALRESEYMQRVGSSSVESTLFHVLRQPPSFELYQTLAVEVQETLLYVILEMAGVARDEFEDFFGPVVGETF